MPGILEGQLASAIYAGFRGKLKKATLWRLAAGSSTTLTPAGDVIDQAPEMWPCEGFTDGYSDYIRATAGIPTTDLKVCVFGASLPAGVRPLTDDKVLIGGEWHQLRKANVDPAGALWTCQAFVCRAPPL